MGERLTTLSDDENDENVLCSSKQNKNLKEIQLQTLKKTCG